MRYIALVAASSLVTVLPIAAQHTGVVSGTVRRADSTLVAGAGVEIGSKAHRTVTGNDGRFLLAGVPAGSYTLAVRMVGFAPQHVQITVASGDTGRYMVQLDAVPAILDPVAVTGEVPIALRGFEERRARNPGAFLTREAIERMQPRQVTDILRRVSGLQVRPVNGAYGNNVAVTARGSRCPVMFYVNGAPFPSSQDVPINHFVSADEVVAVEVYQPSEIPPQYNSSMYNAKCGLIGLWTRSGR